MFKKYKNGEMKGRKKEIKGSKGRKNGKNSEKMALWKTVQKQIVEN